LVFDEISGLPVHPLVVHAAVIFVPLLCAAAVVYALVPRVRHAVGWVAAGLAIAAPGAAWFATLSGGELKASYPPEQQALPAIVDHEGYGDLTFYVSIGLGLVTLALVYLTGTRAGRDRSLPSWVAMGLAGLVVVLALVTGYFVFQAGDSGARAHWG
jgi:hypothetical protein